MKPALDYPDTRLPLPAIRRIGATQPLRWLRAGWHDLKANPLPSLAYGLLFALAGDLIILAGRPAMGKTSLAMNIAFNCAHRFQTDLKDGIDPAKSVGAPVAFFSLEMSADQLASRILATVTQIGRAHV